MYFSGEILTKDTQTQRKRKMKQKKKGKGKPGEGGGTNLPQFLKLQEIY